MKKNKIITTAIMTAGSAMNLMGAISINFTSPLGTLDNDAPVPYNNVQAGSGLNENLNNENGDMTSVGLSFETGSTLGRAVLGTVSGIPGVRPRFMLDSNTPVEVGVIGIGNGVRYGSNPSLDDPARVFTLDLFGFNAFEEVELSIINGLADDMDGDDGVHLMEYTITGDTQIVSPVINNERARVSSAIAYSTVIDANADGEITLATRQLGTFLSPYIMGLIIESESATNVFTPSATGNIPEPTTYALFLGVISMAVLVNKNRYILKLDRKSNIIKKVMYARWPLARSLCTLLTNQKYK